MSHFDSKLCTQIMSADTNYLVSIVVTSYAMDWAVDVTGLITMCYAHTRVHTHTHTDTVKPLHAVAVKFPEILSQW